MLTHMVATAMRQNAVSRAWLNRLLLAFARL